jgi:hypothetical protein
MGKSKGCGDIKNTGLPTEVPTDYLKYNGFMPCFGYVYVTKFKDTFPCLFRVDSTFMLVTQERNCGLLTFSFIVSSSLGLFTGEESRQEYIAEIYRAKRKECCISFIAKPRPNKCFKDWHGLKVLPFQIEKIISDDSQITTKRKFEVLR